MTRYLLDSDVLIDYLRGRAEAVELIEALDRNRRLLGWCAPVITEICAGAEQGQRAVVQQMLNALQFYPVTPPTAAHAGDLIRDYRSKGVQLSPTDATVAAVALSNRLTLVTRNLRHYPMPELRIETY